MLEVKDFDFYLPEELIAQTPLIDRPSSKMLVVNKTTNDFSDHHFSDIVSFLNKGDVLVRNNTKVIPARLFGIKKETNAHVELLLLKNTDDYWECLVGNARVVKVGTILSFGEDLLQGECVEVREEGIRIIKMIYTGIFYELLEQLGEVPLPPYIKEKLVDQNRYQTVYAKVKGSSAAPTAGLHFTNEIIDELEKKGVQIVDVTLHIGLGTFRPVKVDKIENHVMHEEFYSIDEQSAQLLQTAKMEGRRIIAVGTTATRVLETVYKKYQKFVATSGYSNIFIYPGIKMQAIDGLITNFHLPKSTLIMLVSAFASRELILKAYEHAVQEKYRFFSFGDSMFLY